MYAMFLQGMVGTAQRAQTKVTVSLKVLTFLKIHLFNISFNSEGLMQHVCVFHLT